MGNPQCVPTFWCLLGPASAEADMWRMNQCIATVITTLDKALCVDPQKPLAEIMASLQNRCVVCSHNICTNYKQKPSISADGRTCRYNVDGVIKLNIWASLRWCIEKSCPSQVLNIIIRKTSEIPKWEMIYNTIGLNCSLLTSLQDYPRVKERKEMMEEPVWSPGQGGSSSNVCELITSTAPVLISS